MTGLTLEAAMFDANVEDLLAANGLPVADLAAGSPVVLFAQRGSVGLEGVVGIEVLGRAGLVRSLAVTERSRKRGLGRQLVRQLETWAVRHGLEELWLLTTTAAGFFERRGYVRSERESAPDVVRRSEQFASLCPASAVLMRKTLPPAPPPLALAWDLAPVLSGLRVGIGGSTLMNRLGLEDAPRDLDLVCAIDDFSDAAARLALHLERLAPGDNPRFRSAGFARFRAAGAVEVELMAGIEVAKGGGPVAWAFDPARLHWSGGLPWMDPVDWLELYRLFDRPARAAKLEGFLAGGGLLPPDAPGGVTLTSYAPAHRGWFEHLNREWLERWFSVEDIDRRYFADPEGTILAPGGAIFMALIDGRPVGTAAAIPHDGGAFELAKMAVTPAAQGRGIGALLVEAVIGFARRRRVPEVMLLSNSSLQTAIRLYERLGFRHAPCPADTGYSRGNVCMVRSVEH